jgi:hypothetical protein
MTGNKATPLDTLQKGWSCERLEGRHLSAYHVPSAILSKKYEAQADRDDVENIAAMSNSFWWTLPPLPKQKRGKRPAEPGFTDEELQYLENTLQIVSVTFFLGLATLPLPACNTCSCSLRSWPFSEIF